MRADATWCCYCVLTSGLFALRQDATISRPQLVGVDLAIGEAQDVGGVQRRPRLVSRVAAGRVGQAERVVEVGVRTVHQRLGESSELASRAVSDPDSLAGNATGLQGDVLAGHGSRRDTGAQTRLHAIRGVHELVSLVVALAGAGAGAEHGVGAAPVNRDLSRDQAR